MRHIIMISLYLEPFLMDSTRFTIGTSISLFLVRMLFNAAGLMAKTYYNSFYCTLYCLYLLFLSTPFIISVISKIIISLYFSCLSLTVCFAKLERIIWRLSGHIVSQLLIVTWDFELVLFLLYGFRNRWVIRL